MVAFVQASLRTVAQASPARTAQPPAARQPVRVSATEKRNAPIDRRGVLASVVALPVLGLFVQRAQAKDIEAAIKQKEERKEKLKEAAQEAKSDGTAVNTDSLQSARTVPEGQIKSVRT